MMHAVFIIPKLWYVSYNNQLLVISLVWATDSLDFFVHKGKQNIKTSHLLLHFCVQYLVLFEFKAILADNVASLW